MPARLAPPFAGIAPLYPVLSSGGMVRGSSRAILGCDSAVPSRTILRQDSAAFPAPSSNWIAGSRPVLSHAVLQHDSAGVSGGILQQDIRAPSAAAAVAVTGPTNAGIQ